MAEKRNEGLLVGAHPLEQAERISRSIAQVRVVDGALLLDADPTWAGEVCLFTGLQYVSSGLDVETSLGYRVFPASWPKREPTSGHKDR